MFGKPSSRVSTALIISGVLLLPCCGFAEESEPSDDAKGVEEISLEDLLTREVASGETGSFGYRLEEYDVAPYVHAYGVVDYADNESQVSTFDLHYFNLFLGANIRDAVIPEVQLEYEHGGEEVQVRFAQVDVRAGADLLVLRAGKFLVPMGTFNEFLYPEFIAKLPERPLALREIVPVSWAEVGIQGRGKYEWVENRSINYAVYVVNGLEQSDGGEGGSIRSMRNNHRDKQHGNKAIGGRIGIEPRAGSALGLSAYSGAYTADGRQNLSIFDLDLSVTRGLLIVRGELVWARQERAGGGEDLDKNGWHLQASYKIHEKVEPVGRFDTVRLDGDESEDKDRWTAGLNMYPFPSDARNLVWKLSYSWVENRGTDIDDNQLSAQLAIGF